MNLPKIDIPTYDLKLVSLDKNVCFRPFLVKEQKLFFMASESTDSKEMMSTIKQVLKNCVLSNIDIDSLPIFDLEYLFINLRARSVNEIVELKYKCNNMIKNENEEEHKCNVVSDYKINLLDIKPSVNEKHTNKISLNDNLGICLKYPTFELIQKYEGKESADVMMDIITDCIDYVYDKENVYYTKDSTREEIKEFIDNFQQKDLEKIQTFFQTLPEIKEEINFKCGKCGYTELITVKGIENFFG
jgi:hypothetical protein